MTVYLVLYDAASVAMGERLFGDVEAPVTRDGLTPPAFPFSLTPCRAAEDVRSFFTVASSMASRAWTMRPGSWSGMFGEGALAGEDDVRVDIDLGDAALRRWPPEIVVRKPGAPVQHPGASTAARILAGGDVQMRLSFCATPCCVPMDTARSLAPVRSKNSAASAGSVADHFVLMAGFVGRR